MMTKIQLTFAALAACISTTAIAQQGPPCAPRGFVVAKLAEKYGETRRGIGLGARGVMIEVFASDTGSWTIISTRPDGISCVALAGEYYETVAEALPPIGEDG